MKTITINSDDVIWIAGSLYCKTPEALAIALEQARTIGYDVKDQRVDSYAIREGSTTAEKMEQNGWSLWYASLDILRGKCMICNSYISIAGIYIHGTKCSVCGAVLYREIAEGSIVRFEFIGNDQVIFGPELLMEVKRWDEAEGWLYFKYEFLKGGMCVLTGQQGEGYAKKHSHQWELVEEDGQKLMKVRYKHRIESAGDVVIDVLDITGRERNAEIVKIWEGKEYREYSDSLPIPEYFSIYEAWHWAPLKPSPTLHKRVLSAVGNNDDKGWHYQDGRPWFRRETFNEMGKFVRQFTTLDADAWDEQSLHFRLDGPGGIDDVATFCHPDAEVENRPNIGNFVAAITGIDRSEGNLELAAQALREDSVTQDFATELIEHGNRRRRRN